MHDLAEIAAKRLSQIHLKKETFQSVRDGDDLGAGNGGEARHPEDFPPHRSGVWTAWLRRLRWSILAALLLVFGLYTGILLLVAPYLDDREPQFEDSFVGRTPVPDGR